MLFLLIMNFGNTYSIPSSYYLELLSLREGTISRGESKRGVSVYICISKEVLRTFLLSPLKMKVFSLLKILLYGLYFLFRWMVSIVYLYYTVPHEQQLWIQKIHNRIYVEF